MKVKFGKNFADSITEGRKRRRRKFKEAFDWFDPLRANPKISGERISKDSRPWGLFPFYLASLFAFFVFFTRLVGLQLIEGKSNFLLSEENRLRIETIFPERGVILGRDGQILSRNSPGFRVVLRRGVKLNQETLGALSQALSLGPQEIEERLGNPDNSLPEGVILKRGLSQDEVFNIETSSILSSISFIRVDPLREYLYPEEFAHVLGFVGEVSKEELEKRGNLGYVLGEKIGKDGLEAQYDYYLKGQAGKKLLETDAKGRVRNEIARIEPSPGFTLKTTLSPLLQRKAFEFLKETVLKVGATGGVAVGQNPQTGEILFLVSLPSFNPDLFAKGISKARYEKLINDPQKPLFNRALMATYPPGSVFKLVTGAAALEEGVATEEMVIVDKGAIAVGNFVFRGWKEGGHGPITFTDAISKSCDIYFYTVGGGYGKHPGVGVEKLSLWAKEFDLGALTGIDLPGEVGGLIPDERWKKEIRGESWYIGDTYHLAIGQGDLLTTPLQINVLTATIANGGRILKPFLAKEINDPSGKVILSFSPKIFGEGFLKPETIGLIREGMRKAVLPGGTGYPMQGFRFESGGKTGTAEFGGKGKTHAWFTVFTPFDDPEIAVTVLVEGGGEGSSVAAPVARKILEVWAEGREGTQINF